MADNSSQNQVTPTTSFGPGQKYFQEGSTSHARGWQEEPPALEQGAVVPPRAAKGVIPRTLLADRVKQIVAKKGKV